MHTTKESIEQLHRALSDYIEATYHISAPSLIRQRKELLAQPGLIHQTPYLESTPRYRNGRTLGQDDRASDGSPGSVFVCIEERGCSSATRL